MPSNAQLPVVQGAVLVARDGSVVHEAYHGVADLVTEVPVTAQTAFQIASVSKQFTAAAVLLLYQDGLLSLDEEISSWFPGCPRSWERITVHHLLTHTSGLGHWPDYGGVTQARWEDSDHLVEAFYQTPPHSPPHTAWYYSSPGYVLLAKLVERVKAVDYPDFLRRRLFEPLGMVHSSAGNAGTSVDVAQGYVGAAAAKRIDLGVLYVGAGDVWSTAHDLLRWDRALANGDILSQTSRSLMFTSHARVDPESRDCYGYGWALGDLAGHPARYHTGDNPGFRAINAWLTDLDAYVVVLSNQEGTDPHHCATELLATVLN